MRRRAPDRDVRRPRAARLQYNLYCGDRSHVARLVGLGTEVGGWYVAKRHTQNVADAAALAGVMAMQANSTTCTGTVTGGTTGATIASNAANAVAKQDGISSGVTVHCPPQTGSHTTNGSAVEVYAVQNAGPVFASAFLSKSNVQIVSRSVAAPGGTTQTGPVCVLGMDTATNAQNIQITGSSTVTGPTCVVASNGSNNQSVSINGGSVLTAYTITTVGGCQSGACTAPAAVLTKPVTTSGSVTQNPFCSIFVTSDCPNSAVGVTLTNFGTSSTCVNVTGVATTTNVACSSCQQSGTNLNSGTTTLQPNINSSGSSGTGTATAYCAVNTGNGGTLTLTPGTYFFWNGTLNWNGGTINCPSCVVGGAGVTLIVTGTAGGNWGFTANSSQMTITLNAPLTNSYNSAFDGVLLYVVGKVCSTAASGPNNCTNNKVSINGSASTTLNGAIYTPGSQLTYSGGSASNGCVEIIADTVEFSGSSTSGCVAGGTQVVYTSTSGTSTIGLAE
jgi:Putative Flp pilus-assembly TadE/G-like